MGYDKILNQSKNGELANTVGFKDFRNEVENTAILSSDYTTNSMVTRINIGSPGARINDRTNINAVNERAQD